MNLKCDSCLLKFDLDSHRPKSLPCGHTICKECVENPALGTKCPTCKKAFEKRRPQNLPDTAIVVRLLEDEEAPPSKKPKTENPNLAQQLVSASSPQTPQRVQIIKHRDGKIQVKGLMPGQQLVQMPDGKLHVLDTIPPPGQQITTIGQRNANSDLVQKTSSIVRAIQGIPQTPATPVNDASAVPATSAAAYVGPPLFSVLTITNQYLDNGRLNVNAILRDVSQQWSTPRSLRDLKGEGSEDLLRVMGAHLEELQTSGEVQPSVMEEVLKMSALRRLKVRCTPSEKYPDLPLQLEELHIDYATENQLRCLEHMSRLSSLTVLNYAGSNLTFPPSQHKRLLWLCVGFNTGHKFTMMSLIRAHASSVQELRVCCTSNDSIGKSFYFPDLGHKLAACGLSALRRLVLDRRREKSQCTHQAASCLLQRRTVRDALFPLPVEVFCTLCHRAEF